VSANPVRMFSGAASVKAANAYLLALQARRDAWPYLHMFPPPNAKDVLVTGTLATPSLGAAKSLVLQYQVNSGKRFYLTAVILGANVAIVPGQALFTVDRNSAPAGNTQFQPEHGLVDISFQLGSFTVEPFVLQRSREFGPLDKVRVQAANLGLSVGDPAYFVCGLFGYEVPVLDAKSNK
jgi:hypothetical protein